MGTAVGTSGGVAPSVWRGRCRGRFPGLGMTGIQAEVAWKVLVSFRTEGRESMFFN